MAIGDIQHYAYEDQNVTISPASGEIWRVVFYENQASMAEIDGPNANGFPIEPLGDNDNDVGEPRYFLTDQHTIDINSTGLSDDAVFIAQVIGETGSSKEDALFYNGSVSASSDESVLTVPTGTWSIVIFESGNGSVYIGGTAGNVRMDMDTSQSTSGTYITQPKVQGGDDLRVDNTFNDFNVDYELHLVREF